MISSLSLKIRLQIYIIFAKVPNKMSTFQLSAFELKYRRILDVGQALPDRMPANG